MADINNSGLVNYEIFSRTTEQIQITLDFHYFQELKELQAPVYTRGNKQCITRSTAVRRHSYRESSI